MTQKMRRFVEPQIDKKQELLVKQFKTHPVTIEIDGGPLARNSSGTLGGYGNLFSFIGFSSGSDPTAIIKKIFSEKIKFKVNRIKQSGQIQNHLLYSDLRRNLRIDSIALGIWKKLG